MPFYFFIISYIKTKRKYIYLMLLPQFFSQSLESFLSSSGKNELMILRGKDFGAGLTNARGSAGDKYGFQDLLAVLSLLFLILNPK